MVCKLKADFSFYLWHSILVSLTIFSSPVREALNVKENMTGLDYCTLGLKRIKDARKKLDGLRQKMGGYKTTQVLKKNKTKRHNHAHNAENSQMPFWDIWSLKEQMSFDSKQRYITATHTHTQATQLQLPSSLRLSIRFQPRSATIEKRNAR